MCKVISETRWSLLNRAPMFIAGTIEGSDRGKRSADMVTCLLFNSSNSLKYNPPLSPLKLRGDEGGLATLPTCNLLIIFRLCSVLKIE